MSTVRYSYFPKGKLYCKEEHEAHVGTVYATEKLTYEIGENVDPQVFFLALDVMGGILFHNVVDTYLNAPNTPHTWSMMQEQLKSITHRMNSL